MLAELLKEKYSKMIKSEAKRLGFFDCGISKARFLEEEAPQLERWLKEGRNGQMKYMENYFDKRLDPTKLVDGAKSVISLLLPYYPQEVQPANTLQIAKYAYGEDYHFVIKDKLKLLFNYINENIGQISGRIFTDSAPIMERKWATLSGLGWRGKNGLLLTKQGSFFFLAELIIDMDLLFDSPVSSYCGTCTRCIDACPTQAIYSEAKVDGSKCISYLTIELKEKIPTLFKGKMANKIFGCDICQDVCPHNRKPVRHNEPRLSPHPQLLKMSVKDWKNLSEEQFRTIFKKSAVKRTKYKGIIRNIEFIKD